MFRPSCHPFVPRPSTYHPHPYVQQQGDPRRLQPVTQTPMVSECHWTPRDSQPHVQDRVFLSAQQPVLQALSNAQILNNSSFSQHGHGQIQHTPSHAAVQSAQQHRKQPEPKPGYMFSLIKCEQMKKAARTRESDSNSGSTTAKDGASRKGSRQLNNLQPLPRGSASRSRSVISHGQEQQSLSTSRKPKARPQQARIYIQHRLKPVAKVDWCPYLLPDRIVQQLPMVVAPANPVLTQSVLRLMKPAIVYAEFENDICDGCRSRGICVHFSFVLGGRHAPDGLICPLCHKAGIEKSVPAQRVCPEHNNPHISQFTTNLSEDILATDMQRGKAREVLSRSWNCNWEGVESNIKIEPIDDTANLLRESAQPAQDGLQAGNCDEVIPSIEIEEPDPDQPSKRIKINHEMDVDVNNDSG